MINNEHGHLRVFKGGMQGGGELERISLTHFSSCYHDSECAVTINLLSWTTFSHSPTPH